MPPDDLSGRIFAQALLARNYLIFGDIEHKLDVLRVECTRCTRKGGRGFHWRRQVFQVGRASSPFSPRVVARRCNEAEPASLTGSGRRVIIVPLVELPCYRAFWRD